MIKITHLIFILFLICSSRVIAQDRQMDIPKVEVKNGVAYWYGISINEIVNKADLIFEGRILTDSAFYLYPAGHIFTLHQVLVLKKFKGDFTSDIVRVVTWGGRAIINGQSDRTPGEYTFKGDEAVIFATNSSHIEFSGGDSTTYHPFYGPGASYIMVCDKKDVVKEVYEPIEKVTGQGYVDVHPNTCKEWLEAQKKKPIRKTP
jgi:hypothetical protein